MAAFKRQCASSPFLLRHQLEPAGSLLCGAPWWRRDELAGADALQLDLIFNLLEIVLLQIIVGMCKYRIYTYILINIYLHTYN